MQTAPEHAAGDFELSHVFDRGVYVHPILLIVSHGFSKFGIKSTRHFEPKVLNCKFSFRSLAPVGQSKF